MEDGIKMESGDAVAIDRLRATYDSLKLELGKVIVGQEKVIEHLLYAYSHVGTAC